MITQNDIVNSWKEILALIVILSGVISLYKSRHTMQNDFKTWFYVIFFFMFMSAMSVFIYIIVVLTKGR